MPENKNETFGLFVHNQQVERIIRRELKKLNGDGNAKPPFNVVSGVAEKLVIARPTIEHVSIIVTGQVIRSSSAILIVDGILGRTCSTTWRNGGIKQTVVCGCVSVERCGLCLIWNKRR